MSSSRYDEEIDIREFIRVISKRKKIILGVVFVTLVLTSIIVSLMPKTYEVKATIQNGYINTPIITYAEAATLLRSGSFLNPVFEKLGMQIPQERGIRKMVLLENIKDSNLFVIKVRYRDNDLGYSLCREIADAYLEYGNSIYNKQTNLIKSHFSQLEDLIVKTRLDMNKSASVKKESILPLAYPDDKVQMRDLLSQKFQLENQLLLAKGFKLIDKPVKSEKPISPRGKLIIIISCFIALPVGLFCALLVESWENVKSND